MKRVIVLGIVTACLFSLASAEARQRDQTPKIYRENPAFLQDSIRHSDQMKQEKPGVAEILSKVGAEHLHNLDPQKAYILDLESGKVTVVGMNEIPQNQIQDIVVPIPVPEGYGFERAGIRLMDQYILGKAQTYVFCPLRFNTAEVSGFLASNVSRDPLAGIKEGETVSNDVHSQAEVNFQILAVTGGEENSLNRSVMETAHYSVCDESVRLHNNIVTWPSTTN